MDDWKTMLWNVVVGLVSGVDPRSTPQGMRRTWEVTPEDIYALVNNMRGSIESGSALEKRPPGSPLGFLLASLSVEQRERISSCATRIACDAMRGLSDAICDPQNFDDLADSDERGLVPDAVRIRIEERIEVILYRSVCALLDCAADGLCPPTRVECAPRVSGPGTDLPCGFAVEPR